MTASGAEHRLHMGWAEQGKLHALRGDHTAALAHYREAMAAAVRTGAPEVFFRHYLECSLESLELMGALDDVLAYCDRAIAHYAAHPPPHDLAVRDLAHVHQRRGAVLLKQGQRAEAAAALSEACRLQPGAMPLAASLKRWLDGSLHCDAARVTAEQRRHGFFSVRPDTVDARRAVPLPARPSGPGNDPFTSG